MTTVQVMEPAREVIDPSRTIKIIDGGPTKVLKIIQEGPPGPPGPPAPEDDTQYILYYEAAKGI